MAAGPTKSQARARVLEARRATGPDDGDADRCAHLIALAELRGARTVAAYLALPGEPDPAAALARWGERGVTVLLPALLADNDLAFGEIGPAGLRPGRRGTTEPVGETSRESLAHADLVVVPALGVDPAGFRLGRGGGSYDRALRRAGPGALLVALLREGEVGPGPAPEPHDVAIHAAVLPGGIRWLNDPPVVARL